MEDRKEDSTISHCVESRSFVSNANKTLPESGFNNEKQNTNSEQITIPISDQSKNTSVAEVELEGESEKEFDGNIDEDELLKDTETDEKGITTSNKENTFVLASSAESTNKNELQNDKEILNQNSLLESPLSLENQDKAVEKELVTCTAKEKITSIDENESLRHHETKETEDVKNSLKKTNVGSNVETTKITSSGELTVQERGTNRLEGTVSNEELALNVHAIRPSSSTDLDNMTDPSSAELSTTESINMDTTDAENSKVTENKRDEIEESDIRTKFVHIDDESSRPDDSLETMDVGGEDPFAHTSNDNIGDLEKEADTNKGQKDLNYEPIAMDIAGDDLLPSTSDETNYDFENNPKNNKAQDNLISTSDGNSDKNVTGTRTVQNYPDSEVSKTLAGSINSENVLSPELENSHSSEKDETKDLRDSAVSKQIEIDKALPNEFEPSTKNGSSEVETLEHLSDTTSRNLKEASQSKDVLEKNDVNQSKVIPSILEDQQKTQALESGIQNVEKEKLSKVDKKNPPLEKSQESEVCIVPDKALKQTEAIHNQKDERSNVSITNKSKYGKTQSKSKNKSKKESSDESSDDSDFEVGEKCVKRPKRSAAKRAETQIKVLSAVEQEQEVEQEDTRNTDADGIDVQEVSVDKSVPEDLHSCFTCKKVGACKINVLAYGKTNYFCDDSCLTVFREGSNESGEIVPPSSVIRDLQSTDIHPIDRSEFVRKCSQCSATIKNDDEKVLSWETMDFCAEECLGKYQQELGSHCANCKGNVQPASLGKYCVRFGYEVKQFCCSSCLEEFKKGLKVCSFCQKDISSGAEGFLAPVGDKGTFKDFCTQACMEKYEQMSSNQPPPPQIQPCDVCANNKLVEIEIFFDSKINKLCSDICFTAYKFANKLTVDRCDMCKKYFDKDADGEKFNIYYDNLPHNFCCKTCMNVYILAKRKIVPCNWCKVKKYNFDMIKRVQSNNQVLMMCSLNCLTLYQVSVNAVSTRRMKCDMCMSVAQAQYHLTMSDATIRNFCTYPCVMNFQQQYSKSPITLPSGEASPIPTGAPKRAVQKVDTPGAPVPIISSVTSLATGQPITSTASVLSSKVSSGKPVLVTRLLEPPTCRNKNTQTRPVMNTKSVSCRPHTISQHVQTDEDKGRPIIIPIPVPVYVPCPLAMYSFPFPVPVPFAVPLPVPVFLPTTRNSIKGIMKEIKRIQEKVPADPFEAELLMMAEMVAEDKKEAATSSESEPENEPASDSRQNSDGEGEVDSPEMESSNNFGDDIVQMALKMATELDTPSEDMETQLTPSTVANQLQPENSESNTSNVDVPIRNGTEETRGRKRSSTKTPLKRNINSSTKKRKTDNTSDTVPPQSVPTAEEPAPDVNMKLKYTFGVNAWKSWVSQKNAEIEKISSTTKKIKPLKTDILQLTADELNFSLCMFVKEVKKPNGAQYAPDTIYYLCLGIQQYLFENGRIDNIFTDPYFESFTDCLDEIARKFAELFNDHQYIVTRVEEEHLWECKQLGAHSPHVLLTTLLFFNTKNFHLINAEEHLMLSFSHIMKHWKRSSGQPAPVGGKAPGSRNTLLRFYPPQSVLDDPNSKKKKVYEQHEDEENPLRCPVKLYEFYLSKCPESVKSRTDVFYLQPERSCVPDSPVWYSTTALAREPLDKMLNRVKMVKEINVALLLP